MQLTETNADSLTYVYSGLVVGTRYVFHVRALSAVGPSRLSGSASVEVVEGFPPFPEAPGSFTAELTVNKEAQLSWTAPPPSADRSPVTGYAVYRELPSGTAQKLEEIGADSLSYVFANPEPGTRYVFHVRAVSAVGLSEPSASASVEVTEGLPPFPEAPGSFTAELTVTKEALLSWTAPPPSADRSPVTGYAVYRELADGTAVQFTETGADSLTYVYSGLVVGTRYVFHARALSAVGPSRLSGSASVEVVEGLPPFPEAPGSFTAELTVTKEALLSWTAPPPSADRSPITGYAVYRELAGGTAVQLTETHADSLTYVYSGLVVGTRYVFHARALSAVGPSRLSGSASVEVVEGLPPFPEAPGSFAAELTVNKVAQLSWTAPPPSADRSPVTGYAVYRELPSGTAQKLEETGADSLSYVFANPEPGTRYVFHVRALSAVGPSLASGSASIEVVEELPPFPEAPGSFTAELTVNKEALLSWSAPAPSADRATVTGYAVYRELSDGTAEQLSETDADSLSYVHSGLMAGDRYVFHVRALSAVGPSRPSGSASVEVVEGLPPFPEAPGSFAAELTVNKVAQLSWTAPPPSPDRSAVTGYAVYRELPDGTARKLEETDADSLSYVFANPEPGTRYIFHVRALSAVGPSRLSGSASVEVVEGLPPFPEAPGSFAAELTVNKVAQLSWTAPLPSPDRSPVTGYAVYRELPDGTARKLEETDADSLSYVFANPEPGTRYIFHVRALSAVGPSRPSGSASIEVVEGLPPFPEAPGDFTAVLTEGNDAFLSWTAAPPSADRSPVTGYEVFLQGQTQPLGVTNALSHVHTGLQPGRHYVYYVRALSAVGPSLPSNSAAVEVPALTGPIVPISIPHVTVRADQGDGKTVTVSWVHNLVPQLQSLVTGFELQFCTVLSTLLTDHCQGGWKTHTPPLDIGPTTRTFTESLTCDADADTGEARMYRVRAVADNDTLSSRFSVPTRPICPGC